jgi:protein TonB
MFWARPMPPVGSVRDARRVLLYLPGRSAVSVTALKPASRVRMARRPALLSAPKTLHEATPAVASPHPEGMSGNDPLGISEANIARVQAFPAVKPDLSQLTAGSSTDVVVDVEIDETGRVVHARARKGMGREIDDVVVATVEQWLFYPAMKNGHAVTSQQELRFHYDQRPGVASCGWDCFELAGQ